MTASLARCHALPYLDFTTKARKALLSLANSQKQKEDVEAGEIAKGLSPKQLGSQIESGKAIELPPEIALTSAKCPALPLRAADWKSWGAVIGNRHDATC